MDDLLVRFLEKAHEEDRQFKPRTQLARVKESIEYFAEYKIETYFPKSYALMAKLISES